MHKRPTGRQPRWLVPVLLGLLFVVGLALTISRPRTPTLGDWRTDEAVYERLNARLQDLVQSCPIPLVSNDLNHCIEYGLLFLSFDDGEFSAAGAAAIAQFVIFDVDGHGLKPTMIISPSELMDPRIPDEKHWLVLYHEFWHFKQIHDRRVPWESFLPVERDSRMSPEEAEQVYEVECDAYLAEAKIAASYGWSNHEGFCQAYAHGGVPELRTRVAEALGMSIGAFAEHRSLLDELAGRPMPDSLPQYRRL